MKTVAVVAKRGSEAAEKLAAELQQRYPNLKFLAERELAHSLGWDLPASAHAIAEEAELLVCLGGDGTLIHAARLLRGRPVPVLGVNLGSLGFLTEVAAGELFEMLDQVLAGTFTVDPRMKLRCRLYRESELVVDDEVLNDVVINKGALARIADHECSVDGHYVASFKSDGIIVSTPTGSTAYNLSAGGPIVHPSVDCAIIAPICPHALTQRPIVVPGDRTISILLKNEVADVYLTLDGQAGHALQTGDRLEVQKSPNRLHLIRNPKRDYFNILRQKLHWESAEVVFRSRHEGLKTLRLSGAKPQRPPTQKLDAVLFNGKPVDRNRADWQSRRSAEKRRSAAGPENRRSEPFHDETKSRVLVVAAPRRTLASNLRRTTPNVIPMAPR